MNDDDHPPNFWLVEHALRGGHVHVTLRCGLQPHSRAKAGEGLIVRAVEWPELQQALAQLPNVEFRDETPPRVHVVNLAEFREPV